jgi:1-acyl-sn-glycerol-3-phosphate acyltransferase
MIGRLRLVFALSCVTTATILLVPVQLLAMKTGWFSENFARGLWHRVNIRALGFRIHRTGEMTAKRPLLIASNHISWTDIEVMASLYDISFIAKSDLAGWPLIGWLSRLQRPVYVERTRKRTSGAQASEIAQRLTAGEAVVLFAEGTTGDGNRVLPFKSTLFGAATMAISEGAVEKVYIQPVAVAYTRLHGLPMGRRYRPLAAWIGDQELVPTLGELLRLGAIDVELHFGEPIEFTAGSNRKETARQVESRVHEMMQAALRNPVRSVPARVA